MEDHGTNAWNRQGDSRVLSPRVGVHSTCKGTLCSMSSNPREVIGLALSGNVLEIGPGSRPFTVAPDAKVSYADRSVEGGRDANWPELIGAPAGVQAQYDLNLDTDGLSAIDSGPSMALSLHTLSSTSQIRLRS